MTEGAAHVRRTGFILSLLAVIAIVLSSAQSELAHAQAEHAQFVTSATDLAGDCGETHPVTDHCATAAACQLPAPIENVIVTFDVPASDSFHLLAQSMRPGRTSRPDLQPPRHSIQA